MPLSRVSRQFQVFDIAIVAVQTKALGAFLILVIILLPYYKSDPANAPVFDAVRNTLDDARRDIEIAQQELNKGASPQDLAKRIEHARKSIEHAQGYVQGLRNKLDQASGQIKRLEGDLAENKVKTDEVQKQLTETQTELAKLEASARELERDNSRLKGENADLKARADRLMHEEERLRDQNQGLQSKLQAELRDSQELRDRDRSREQELSQARQERDTLQQENQRLRDANDGLAQRANRNMDASIVMRWFSIGLIIPDCADIQFSTYVRWQGSLVNAGTGIEMPNDEFDVTDPRRRTVLLGHRYFDLGGKQENNPLGEKTLREAGIGILGKGQIKLFNAVSSQVGEYRLYIAANDPRALSGRKCAVHPYFLSWAGAVLGERVLITQDQPFAWLRHFRINKDGSNTLGFAPRDDKEFQDDLDSFSIAQSQRLCKERSICGKEDAHHFALRSVQRSSR
jgi:peptidoglycan hydrolase CwlO-like protein